MYGYTIQLAELRVLVIPSLFSKGTISFLYNIQYTLIYHLLIIFQKYNKIDVHLILIL